MRVPLKLFTLIMVALLAIGLAGAQPAASVATSAVAPPPAALRVVTLGESTNTGLGDPKGCGYRRKLAELMKTAAPGGTNLPVTFTGTLNGSAPNDCKIPYGHFGQTVQDLRANVLNWLDADQPDVILIMVGINNSAGAGVGLNNWQYEVTQLLNTIGMWHYPNAHQQIFIATIPYSVASWAQNEVTANEGILNAINSFAGYPGASMIHPARADYMPCVHLADGIHPDGAGYDVIAYQFYAAMAPVFGLESLPLNSIHWADQHRPGFERSATACT
jgi:lysophospholipase L1-like esterase